MFIVQSMLRLRKIIYNVIGVFNYILIRKRLNLPLMDCVNFVRLEYRVIIVGKFLKM